MCGMHAIVEQSAHRLCNKTVAICGMQLIEFKLYKALPFLRVPSGIVKTEQNIYIEQLPCACNTVLILPHVSEKC